MTAAQEQLPNDVDGLPVAGAAGAGALLRAAREAAGLSLDQVAQQLKLAPRQVKAIEDESFGELPGRTFSRGFVRNYARLLHLDAQDLLAHLPDVAQAPALGSPTLHSTAAVMGELPSTTAPKAGLGRWLIPLILIGCIIAAAAYEWYRGGLSNNAEPARSISDATDRRAPSTTAPAVALPNPLASPSQTAGAQATTPPAATLQSAGPQSAPLAASTLDSVATPAGGATFPASAAPGDGTLLLTYRGPSWTEIRDRSGQTVVSRLVAAGSIEPVDGAPPFDIVLGNAHVVTLVYRGKSIDLSPYTRQNVARLTLQ
ncbi:MAG TPA: RodZ domain-containing protein [Casimicrobiaceae bacterium]|nr:RodZ domain-containing protein [Casimicrobiaceae bacterium]